jgi:uncharacterized protein (DUF305 family)
MRTCRLALVAAVLLAACSDSAPTPTTIGVQTAAFNDADVRFLQAMIPHHQQAIDAAKLVGGRSHRSQLVKLADTIATRQPAEIQTMKGWLQRWQPMPATGGMAPEGEPAPGMMSQGQLDGLATLDGHEFDLGFTTSMKTHHLGAIEMANSILQEGRSSEVRMLANQILTAQQHEVDQLAQWHDALS